MTTHRIEIAKQIAASAHRGQKRRDGITPYTRHLRKVANLLESSGASEYTIIVGWLHDAIEDGGDHFRDIIAKKLRQDIADCCWMLNKGGRDYEQYIEDIRLGIIREDGFMPLNPAVCRHVKIADIVSNLTDDPTPEQIVKYTKALIQLCG